MSKRKVGFIDYKLKSDVMKEGLHTRINVIDRYDFLQHRDFVELGIVPSQKYDDEYVNLTMKYGSKWIKEARKINIASYRRIQRLKDRITSYLNSGQCVFATLTFSDDVLQTTTEKQRRVMVSRFLKGCSDKYVANIDYGFDDKYSHREHYHAIVLTDFISDHWDGGFSWYERIHSTNSNECLAKYISKLCNHAIKDSTKRACYIYSR